MSGYDGGHLDEGGSNSRGVARKPVTPREAANSAWSFGAGSTAPLPNPAIALSSHPYTAAHEEVYPVSPASSTRGSPAPEAQREHGQRHHQNVSAAAQRDYDWHSLPSQQRQQQQREIQPPSTTEPPGQWRQSYGREDARDSGPERQHGRGVSWQAAPRTEATSQSPPNPTYQEISATVSQRREDREQEVASRVVPSREASWLGSPVDEQAPNPNYNEIITATRQWRHSRERVQTGEEGGSWPGGQRPVQMPRPQHQDLSTPEANQGRQGNGQFLQEELPAGRAPDPPAPVYQALDYFPSVSAPGSAEQRVDGQGRAQYDVSSPVAVTSWQALPTIPAPEMLPLRVDIPTAQGSHWQGSRERQELERARQASWQDMDAGPHVSSSEQALPAHRGFREQRQRQDEIAPVPPTHYPRQEQTPGGQAHGGSRGPFMHYEDYTFFDSSLSPKDELQSQGIRPADTFSTVPENEIQPQARKSWARQQRQRPQHRGGNEKGGAVRPTSCGREFILPWTSEILWSLLSIVCVVIIAVVLKIYDGHALPSWPLGITLNALVAFFATLCRAAFIVPVMEGLSQLKWNWFARGERQLLDFAAFEDASRSPLGWARLLFMGRGRALGVCAALVLLTSLVSSPLTQLLIHYPTQYVADYTSDSVATVPRSEAYYYPDSDAASHGDLDIHQKRAIQQGIYHHANETFPHILPTCGSSECRWDKFSSLAVCSSTTDISNQLTVSDHMKGSHLGLDLDGQGDALVHNASLPNGVFLVGGPASYSMNMSMPPDHRAQASLAFADESDLALGTFARFYVIYVDPAHDALQESTVFRATEVGLRFCVNTYNIVVSQGVATTSIVDSITKVTANVSSEKPIALAREILPNSGGSAVLHSRGDAQHYGISGDHVQVLRDYVESVFVGTYSSKRGAKVARSTTVSDTLGMAMYKGEFIDTTVAEGKEDKGRVVIGNVMQNVATSLTNTIRSLGTTQAGVVLIPQSYVQVRWPWLAFLAAQVFLAGAFLVSIMAQTAVWKVKVLKGSSLATLFAIGAEDKVLLERQSLGSIDDGAEMTRQGGRITAKFSNGDKGWVLNLGRHGAGV